QQSRLQFDGPRIRTWHHNPNLHGSADTSPARNRQLDQRYRVAISVLRRELDTVDLRRIEGVRTYTSFRRSDPVLIVQPAEHGTTAGNDQEYEALPRKRWEIGNGLGRFVQRALHRPGHHHPHENPAEHKQSPE